MDDSTCCGTCLMKSDLQNSTDKFAFLKDNGLALDKLKVLINCQNRNLTVHSVSLMFSLMSS